MKDDEDKKCLQKNDFKKRVISLSPHRMIIDNNVWKQCVEGESPKRHNKIRNDNMGSTIIGNYRRHLISCKRV